jgi:hypothetical protein
MFVSHFEKLQESTANNTGNKSASLSYMNLEEKEGVLIEDLNLCMHKTQIFFVRHLDKFQITYL